MKNAILRSDFVAGIYFLIMVSMDLGTVSLFWVILLVVDLECICVMDRMPSNDLFLTLYPWSLHRTFISEIKRHIVLFDGQRIPNFQFEPVG